MCVCVCVYMCECVQGTTNYSLAKLVSPMALKFHPTNSSHFNVATGRTEASAQQPHTDNPMQYYDVGNSTLY